MSVIFNEPGGGGGINYVSNTPPSSPSDGQLWYKPTDNGVSGTAGLWVYRITQADPLVAYWVSATAYKTGLSLNGAAVSASSNSFALGANFNPLSDLLWIDNSEICFYHRDRAQNATDHWDIEIGFCKTTAAGANPIIQSISTDTDLIDNISLPVTNTIVNTVNDVVNVSVGTIQQVRYFHSYTKVGSNTNRIGLSGSITYREVHP